MHNTNIIIFSKNRTLQLKSLLRSANYYSDIDDSEITILYKTEPEIQYEPLISEFGCNFVKQKGNFIDDLKNIVTSSTKEYIMLLVDDLIFKDKFSLREIESLLTTHNDIDCFSMRLGKHILGGKPPEFKLLDNKILVWDTNPGLGTIWNFFWELSSSIYRKSLVLEYLNKCKPSKITYPNPLETHYYSQMPNYLRSKKLINRICIGIKFVLSAKTNRMACYQTSKAFTQGVNLVAERGIPNTDHKSPLDLHRKMEEGYIIDYNSILRINNDWPNTGLKHFRLVNDIKLD